ncbi:MAG: type II toxin-antitoxin system RelE/ParE family toxin [Bacteroidota bacterium]
MARQIIWSLRAQRDRKEILEYWQNRNKSNIYGKKLNQLFKEAISIISDYPKIGKSTDLKKVRIKIVKDYFILYKGHQTPNQHSGNLG